MRLRALAKINLGLDVVRKREDGYNELRMIMQKINMYDQLEMEISEEAGIHITSNLPFVPTNENNLVYKAAKLLMDGCNIGIQAISEYVNDNPGASSTSKELASQLSASEEELMRELKVYL